MGPFFVLLDMGPFCHFRNGTFFCPFRHGTNFCPFRHGTVFLSFRCGRKEFAMVCVLDTTNPLCRCKLTRTPFFYRWHGYQQKKWWIGYQKEKKNISDPVRNNKKFGSGFGKELEMFTYKETWLFFTLVRIGFIIFILNYMCYIYSVSDFCMKEFNCKLHH